MCLKVNLLPLILPRALALLFLTIPFSASLYSQEPENSKHLFANKFYRDFQIGTTLAFTEMGALPVVELSASHGINVSKRFSAGIGLSTMYFVTLTAFVQCRLNFKEQGRLKRSIPFISFKAGYLTYIKKADRDQNSIHLEPRIGYSFVSKLEKHAWAVFIAGNYFEDNIYPKIGVGFEF